MLKKGRNRNTPLAIRVFFPLCTAVLSRYNFVYIILCRTCTLYILIKVALSCIYKHPSMSTAGNYCFSQFNLFPIIIFLPGASFYQPATLFKVIKRIVDGECAWNDLIMYFFTIVIIFKLIKRATARFPNLHAALKRPLVQHKHKRCVKQIET